MYELVFQKWQCTKHVFCFLTLERSPGSVTTCLLGDTILGKLCNVTALSSPWFVPRIIITTSSSGISLSVVFSSCSATRHESSRLTRSSVWNTRGRFLLLLLLHTLAQVAHCCTLLNQTSLSLVLKVVQLRDKLCLTSVGVVWAEKRRVKL